MKKFMLLCLLVAITISLVPSYAVAEDKDVRVGDKLILDGGYEAVCIGHDNGGRPQYQVDLSAPKYLEDKVTLIDTSWHSDGVGFSSGANKFGSYVLDEFVSVSDKGKKLSWQPSVTVSNLDDTKGGYKNGKLTSNKKAKILAVDPLNSNYKNNTLEWDLGNGVYRRLRIIEGIQQEYYVVTKPISGDFKIEHNIVSDELVKREPVAWDKDNKGIELAVTESSVELKKDKTNVKYPIIIDPDVTFVSSSSDGYTYNAGAVYVNARTAVNGLAVFDTGVFVGTGNSWWESYYLINRGFVYFNTSSLSGYVITAAVLRLNLNAVYDDNGESLQIQSGMPTYPHDPLVVGDYDLTNYAGNGGTKTLSTMSAGSYNNINLNAGGLAMINTAGWTKLCLRTTGDINNTTPAGKNQIYFYAYEQGVNYRPQLVVTFTPNTPAIISVPASNITTETARFNSLLMDDGSGAMGVEDVDVRFGYCATATLADLGGIATGSPISLLPNGVDNDVDVTGLGTFTVTIPAGHVGVATSDVCNVVGSPVALVAGANVIDTDTIIGNIKITVTLSNFANYANITAWDDNGGSYYHTGAVPYYDATGLTLGTQYYFAVQARNTVGTTTSTLEEYFTTLVSVADMVQFTAYPNSTSINLNWVKAAGANRTMIRYRLDTYPTSETGADGSTEVYFNTGTSYLHSGLTEGVTYYYSAWGETLATYSTNEINLVMTTGVALTPDSIPSGSAPSGGWFVNPNETFLANLQPWYSVVNGMADSWGMPRANAWFLMVILFVLIIGIGTYLLFHAPALSLIAMALAITLGITIHLLSPYILVVVLFLCLGAWSTRPQGGLG